MPFCNTLSNATSPILIDNVNIAAGNKEQIQAVIESNTIPPLIQLLSNVEFDIRKEAACAISNALVGGDDLQIKFLVQKGCIRPLCALLTRSENEINAIVLKGIERILQLDEVEARANNTPNQIAIHVSEAEGGLSKIEELRQHCKDIHEKSINILETYFGVLEVEERTLIAPSISISFN